MAYQVLYRKYRPRDFSEVVGQSHIVAVLERQVAAGHTAHAYLFSGPRGVGKTTVARLIAKAVNCANAPGASGKSDAGALNTRQSPLSAPNRLPGQRGLLSPKGTVASGDGGLPCNTCDSCLAFNTGSALNLIEIDAASNRGIDEIRELREAVRFTPAGGGTKVYVIDEVHQLTKDAFNALLKTLEEPPAHAAFILATTELDKVPPTIVSRTQHFEFRRPRADVLRDRLLAVAAKEKVALAADAAEAIAFAAEGSVRDAESMLGKIMAVEDNAITRTEVEEILGIPKQEALGALLAYIGRGELAPAIELVNRLYHDGYEMEYLAKLIVSFFRDALLMKTAPDATAAAEAPGASDAIRSLGLYSADALADAIVAFIEAIPAVRRSPIPQLPLELALVKIVSSHGAKT